VIVVVVSTGVEVVVVRAGVVVVVLMGVAVVVGVVVRELDGDKLLEITGPSTDNQIWNSTAHFPNFGPWSLPRQLSCLSN
jgi:hypothetical protein